MECHGHVLIRLIFLLLCWSASFAFASDEQTEQIFDEWNVTSELRSELRVLLNQRQPSMHAKGQCTKIPGTDYKCQGHPYRVMHPPSNLGQGPFPLLGFFHALFMKGWDLNGYCSLLETVNSFGYTIIMPFDQAAVPPSKVITWVKTALECAQQQKFDRTDYSRVGIFGHSMGGGTVVHAMADQITQQLNIKAGFALHPWLFEAQGNLPKDAKGPIAYTTGTKDTCVRHEPQKVKTAFSQAPSPKIFANLNGANHMEPLNSPLGHARWSPYVGYFFDCYIKASGSACTKLCQGMNKDPDLPLADFEADCGPAPAPPSPPSPSPQAVTLTMKGDTTKCLDLRGGDTSNGNTLELWDCNGIANQQWVFAPGSWKITYALDTSKCLDAGDMSDGRVLQIWDCNGNPQQQLGFDASKGSVYLKSSMRATRVSALYRPYASKCLDVAGGRKEGGTAIQVWDCNGASNQAWSIIPANSVITLQSDSTVCLDLKGGDTTNGNKVQLWKCNGLANQQWIFAAGSWKIVFAASPSKCIDAGSMDDGAELQIWDCNGYNQQVWGFDGSVGTLYLPKASSGLGKNAKKCMDVVSGSTTVQAWDCSGKWNQQWNVASSGAAMPLLV